MHLRLLRLMHGRRTKVWRRGLRLPSDPMLYARRIGIKTRPSPAAAPFHALAPKRRGKRIIIVVDRATFRRAASPADAFPAHHLRHFRRHELLEALRGGLPAVRRRSPVDGGPEEVPGVRGEVLYRGEVGLLPVSAAGVWTAHVTRLKVIKPASGWSGHVCTYTCVTDETDRKPQSPCPLVVAHTIRGGLHGSSGDEGGRAPSDHPRQYTEAHSIALARPANGLSLTCPAASPIPARPQTPEWGRPP